MNINELPFETEQMIASLRTWVEAESPSFEATAVNKVIDLAAYDLASMGATIERVPGRFGFGDILRATIDNGAGENSKAGVVICCHADTAHPLGSLHTMPYRREGNKLFGAGVLSCKSGLLISLEAVRQLIRNNIQLQLPVTFLIAPDKEAGCPSSREFIEATVRQAKFALVPEPAVADGGVVLGRSAVLRFELDVKVDTVHELKSSDATGVRSPIYEMARHVIDIEEMSTADCNFSVGTIQSGQWANFAEKCLAEVISEAKTAAAVKESTEKMLALNSPNPDSGLHVNRSVKLPLWEPDAHCKDLYNELAKAGEELNLELNHSAAGGGSLGNISGAMGIATLDGLGACGLCHQSPGACRSRAEYLEIDSLSKRGKLMAALLARLN